jgi:hypothetical protein
VRLEITARAELTATHVERGVGERAGWRAVAMPSEHGGWGLTLEPAMGIALVAVTAVGVLW